MLISNCAVLQEELLISELFGHEEGAFTGAVKQKRGLVEKLDGGTLFLDELPDLPPRVHLPTTLGGRSRKYSFHLVNECIPRQQRLELPHKRRIIV